MINKWKAIRASIMILACGMFLLPLTGCGKSEAQAVSPQPPASGESAKKNDAPKPPGHDEVLFETDMVKELRRTDTGYVHDEKIPAGQILGVFRFVGLAKGAKSPPTKVVELSGPNAIKDPQKDELEFYSRMKVKEERYIHHDYLVPANAVVMLKGVKVGRRPQLSRPIFNVSFGRLQNQYIFCAPNERPFLSTWDSYPCHIEIASARSGNVLFKDTLNYQEGEAVGGRISPPKPVQAPIIKDIGRYTISCKRHPWQRAHLFIVDNPYATVGYGSVVLDGVPVGTHTLEVWHPIYEPLKKTIQVEVTQDKTTEIAIEFKAPPDLAAQ